MKVAFEFVPAAAVEDTLALVVQNSSITFDCESPSVLNNQYTDLELEAAISNTLKVLHKEKIKIDKISSTLDTGSSSFGETTSSTTQVKLQQFMLGNNMWRKLKIMLSC